MLSLLTASFDRTARVWNAATGGQLAVLRGHSAGLYGAAFSLDRSLVVTAHSVERRAFAP